MAMGIATFVLIDKGNGGGWVTNLIGVPKWWCYLPEQPKEGGNG